MSYLPDAVGTPRPRRHPARLLLIVLSALVLLAASAVAGYLVGNADRPDRAAGDATPRSAANPSAVPAAETVRTTVVLPDTLDDQPKADLELPDPFDDLADYGVTAKMAGVWAGDVRRDPLLVAAAVAVTKGTAQQRFDDFQKRLTRDLAAGNFSQVEPGQLGGISACGDGKFSNQDAGVCIWSDQSTTGFIVRTRSNGLAIANTSFRQIRAEIERPA